MQVYGTPDLTIIICIFANLYRSDKFVIFQVKNYDYHISILQVYDELFSEEYTKFKNQQKISDFLLREF